MSSGLATISLIALAWLSFAAVTSLVVTLAWCAGAGRLRRARPDARAAVALAAAIAPSLLPTLLVVVCLAPGLAGLFGWHGDHCLAHAGHPHLCLVHTTAVLDAPLGAVLALAGAGLVLALFLGIGQLARGRRYLASLHSGTTRALGPDTTVVASQQPLSFVTGLAQRRIWVSAALAEALPEDDLEVVLMHERAHLERYDPLRRAAAIVCSIPLWPAVRRAILAELALASERVCDELAGQRLGDRLRVAETILRVERLASAALQAPVHGLVGFGGCAVAERVNCLLDDAPGESSLRGASWFVFLAASGLMALLADRLHHATEHWLRLLGAG